MGRSDREHLNNRLDQVHHNSRCDQVHLNSKCDLEHHNSKCDQVHLNSKCDRGRHNKCDRELLGSNQDPSNPQIHWEECWAESVVQHKMPAVGCLRVSSKAPHLLLYFGCLANLPKQAQPAKLSLKQVSKPAGFPSSFFLYASKKESSIWEPSQVL